MPPSLIEHPDKDSIDKYVTTRQAARMLDISLRTAQVWVERGLLEAWKTEGGHRRILRDSVDRLTASKSAGATKGRRNEAKEVNALLRVLVVEDDASILRLYRMKIEAWSIPVELSAAKNAFEALVLLGARGPHLLISDLRMPGLDGFQLLRAICGMDELAELEIAVVSGIDAYEIQQQGGLPERVNFFPKPVPFDALETLAREIALRRGILKPGESVIQPAAGDRAA
jgi:excisionase family DNA binding protein